MLKSLCQLQVIEPIFEFQMSIILIVDQKSPWTGTSWSVLKVMIMRCLTITIKVFSFFRILPNVGGIDKTRMHSSKMRTVGCSNHLGGCLAGGVYVRGVSPQGGSVSAQGVSGRGKSAQGVVCHPPPP